MCDCVRTLSLFFRKRHRNFRKCPAGLGLCFSFSLYPWDVRGVCGRPNPRFSLGILKHFMQTVEWLGSNNRYGCTKMDTFRLTGKHGGDLGYKSKSYGTHQSCPHSGWTWKAHVGSNKAFRNHRQIEKVKHSSKLWDEIFSFAQNKKRNDRIGKIYRLKEWTDRF